MILPSCGHHSAVSNETAVPQLWAASNQDNRTVVSLHASLQPRAEPTLLGHHLQRHGCSHQIPLGQLFLERIERPTGPVSLQ